MEWILSFPRAPLGSVSIQIWSNVCATAIGVVADILGSLLAVVISQKQSGGSTAGKEAKKTQ